MLPAFTKCTQQQFHEIRMHLYHCASLFSTYLGILLASTLIAKTEESTKLSPQNMIILSPPYMVTIEYHIN